jgi:hypothetical protein
MRRVISSPTLNKHFKNGKMEEDVKPKDEDGVDGQVCDLGVVGAPLIFGLTRGAGAFAGGLLTFALVSGFQLAQHNRGKCHFFRAAFSSQLEAMVGGALVRASAVHVDLGVGGTTIASGSRVRTSHSWTSRLLTSSFSFGVSSLFCRATQCM